jgi:hypothetical protein
MTQQTIDVGAAANDGTGEPLRNAFTAVNDNFTQIWTAGPVGSQVRISGNIITTTVTNLGLTLAGNGIGNIQANSTIVPGTAGVYDLGAPDNRFQYIYSDYLVGNGALITGIVANTSYNNSNVAAFLPTYTGNLVSLTGPVRTTANVIAGNIITSGFLGVSGNISGGNITGVNLISSGSISAVGNITTAGNIAGNYFLGNGAFLTGITATNISAAALTGTTLSSNVLYSSLKVVDDLLYLDVIGNVTTQGIFIGSGAGLTNIPAANISGSVANATYAVTAGTAYSVAGANVTGAVANATYATTAGSAITATTANTANSVAGANVRGAVANAIYATAAGSATTATTAITAATVTTAAQPNITSVGTLTTVAVSGNATAGNLLTTGQVSAIGNISGNYFIGNGALLTGITSNASANANALIGTTLSSNVIYSSLQILANLQYLNVDGNVTTQGRFIGSGAGLTNLAGANVTGTVANATYAVSAGSATTANSAVTAVTVTANAQPNITSVGTLTSVSVTGNTNVGRLGIGQANLYITNTYPPVLTIQADATQFTSNIDVATNIRTYALTANATVSAIGNITGGNLLTGGNATAAYFVGNGRQLTGIVATSVGNLDNLVVIGNTTTGNLLTGGLISAVGNIKTVGNVTGNYFVGNGALLTGITVSAGTSIVNGNSNVVVGANGNITVGVTGTSNISVFTPAGVEVIGQVSATGNIRGNYILGNGAFLSGLPVQYGNADVANYLPTYTGNLVSLTGPVTTTANVTGANVLTGGLVSAAGNVVGNYILGNGALLTGVITSVANINNGTSNITVVSSGGNITVGVNAVSNVAVFADTGEYITGELSATGNISGNYFIGNGSQLTGVAASSVNANALVGNTLSSNVLYSSLTQVGTLSNVSVSGNVVGGNVLTGGVVSATGNVTSGGVITTGPSGNISGANVISATTFSATGNVTSGNLLTFGTISAVGNISGNGILTDHYYYANGVPVPFGIGYTAAISPPGTPNVADQWYDTASDVLYEYINDGTTSYWVDTTSPAFAGGVVANVAISGTLTPVANVTFDIGTSTVYFRNTYTQNLYTNNRLPATNMPVGAVVQTVMSSSLGGSITNSGSYVDVTYANVTITTSSAANKVLIIATGTSDFGAVVGSGITADTQLVRSPSTSLQIQTVATTGTGGVGATGAIAYSYLDSPATNGSITYKLQQRVSNTSSTLTSKNIWLIAMEIAAT